MTVNDDSLAKTLGLNKIMCSYLPHIKIFYTVGNLVKYIRYNLK